MNHDGDDRPGRRALARVAVRLLFILVLVGIPGIAGAQMTTGGAAPGDGSVHTDPLQALPDTLVIDAVADAVQEDVLEPRAANGTASAPETWCGTETTIDDTANARFPNATPQLKVVYAYAADQPNRFAQLKDRLQANVSLLSRFVASQSQGRKTLRWDLGTSCGQQYVDVQVLRLPKTLAHYTVSGRPDYNLADADAIAALAPSQSGPRNWVVYADSFGINGYSGTARLRGGDALEAPQHDSGRMTAFVWGPQTLPTGAYVRPTTMLHEIGHNLGAVQQSAQHSTGAGHCSDRYDVMCYADGSARGGTADMTYPCPTLAGEMNEALDCGGDDYFNVNPAAGSYLDTHWNVYRSAHLGACSTELEDICGLSGPAGDGTPPANTTPTVAGGWRSGTYTVELAGTDTQSAVNAWNWRVDSGAAQSTNTATFQGTGTHTLYTRVRDAAGNWSRWRAETLRFENTAPTLNLSCPSGWRPGRSSCQAVASDSGGSGFARTEYRTDGGTVQTSTTSLTDIWLDRDGAHAIEARSVDNAGNTSPWRTGTLSIDAGKPIVNVSCPYGWQTEAVDCQITATDTTSGVSEFTWTIAGGPAQTGSSPATIRITGGGNQTIVATAVDRAGNRAQNQGQVLVDTTPPVVTVSCGDAWQQTPECTWQASDPESYVVQKWVQVDDGEPYQPFVGETRATGTGEHQVRVRAHNEAGLTAWSEPTTLKLDETPPTGELRCQPLGEGRHSCSAAASDEGSGVRAVGVARDGAHLQDLVPGQTITVLGPARLTGRVTDNVGRTTDAAALELTGPPPYVPPPPPAQTLPTVAPPREVPPAVTERLTLVVRPSKRGAKSVRVRLAGAPHQRLRLRFRLPASLHRRLGLPPVRPSRVVQLDGRGIRELAVRMPKALRRAAARQRKGVLLHVTAAPVGGPPRVLVRRSVRLR